LINLKGVAWTLGLLSTLFGVGMLIPALVAWIYHTGHVDNFLVADFIAILTGLTLLQSMGPAPQQLSNRDGFLIVALAWIVLTILGAIPFWTTGVCHSLMDGLFESASGLTTTGATVLLHLDSQPPSILFWRSMQQWLGGMGIVVLTVAVIPMLGVGGMQLLRAETPGPIKDKLTARVTQTGKVLWSIYLVMTIACAVAYWLAGMTTFDAINHAMTTLSTGGFSTHDASFGYFTNTTMSWIAIFFMFLASTNFTLHFAALRRGLPLAIYMRDDEFFTYLKWIGILVFLTGLLVIPNSEGSFTQVVFNIVSVVTTTGFSANDYSLWPQGTTLLFLAAMLIGGSAGSTSGGIKVVRVLLLYRQGMREINRLIHPHAVSLVQLGKKRLSNTVMQSVWGFFALFMLCFAILSFAVACTGVDVVTAVSAAAACISNTGPGFAQVGPSLNYDSLSDSAKGLLILGMIMGRLEIFTFFVLLIPTFWRD